MLRLLIILLALVSSDAMAQNVLPPIQPSLFQSCTSGYMLLGGGAGLPNTCAPLNASTKAVLANAPSGPTGPAGGFLAYNLFYPTNLAILANPPNAAGGFLSYNFFPPDSITALAVEPGTAGGFALYGGGGGGSSITVGTTAIVGGTTGEVLYDNAAGKLGVTSGSGGGGSPVFFPITSYGCVASTSTGSADQASCIQSAINAASAAGGGIVQVPAGYWNLKSQVTLNNSVTLQCANNGHSYGPPPGYSTVVGAVFAVLWGSGSGNSNNPGDTALILRANSRVLDCGWWYPSQVAGTASTPTEYGATIMIWDSNGDYGQEAGGNYCFNCYSFIDFRGSVGAGKGVVNSNIHDNAGAPIWRGIAMNFVVDWVTVRDNSFNSGMLNIASTFTANNLVAWVAQNGSAFYYGNGTWVKEIGNQAWGYKQCHFLDGTTFVDSSFPNVGPLEVVGPGCDGSYYGFFQNGGTVQDLQITGYNGTAFCQLPLCQSTNWPGSLVALNSGSTMLTLNINGVYLFGPVSYAVYGSGSTIGSVSVTNAHIRNDNTTNGWNAFTLGTATNVSILGSWTHGFSGVLYCASCTNTNTTGSWNN
jgi:hypothetical protein